jgi:Protein of unknown function (DUF3443)
VRKFVVLALIQLGFLAACGGGGYGSSSVGNPPPPPPTQMIATPGPPNVETLTVDAGPAGAINTAFVSVRVCVPGSPSSCKTIDHIEVDTGSIGLRILSSALTAAPAITLPAHTNGTNPLAECLRFADGDAWGPNAVADIQLPVSGESATNVNVQVIGDPAYATLPMDCMTNPENTVAKFGANGILGVGPFAQDCGSACVGGIPSTGAVYYGCPSTSTCGPVPATLVQQLQNPVTLFATDTNGVIVELPAVAAAGATTVSGSLVFGIGTRTNNALGMATVLPEDPSSGNITGTYKGTAYANGYLDSGSNGNYFTDSSLTTPACTGSNAGIFYCPTSMMSETATLKGTTTTTLTANFSVGDADTIPAGYTAFPGLAGPNSDPLGFDLGLPFFYGHNVYTAIEGNTVSGNMGPFFAY